MTLIINPLETSNVLKQTIKFLVRYDLVLCR